MKQTKLISAIILLVVMAGCKGSKQSEVDVITVDVSANYPEKELILQDIMDVEYVPLETTDEFLTNGIVKAIGKNVLLVTSRGNGDIFIFDRNGKGLRKINRMGQSGEEYSQVTSITLDEDRNEMYVTDYPARKILVYDLNGGYRRSFPFADTSYYHFMSNYDRDHLICFKGYSPTIETEQSGHILISKEDGSVTREIEIPFKEIDSPVFTKGDLVVTPNFCLITPYHNDWILTRASSDTIYDYMADGDLIPLIARTPSIHSMDPQVFLFPTVFTDRYYFMRTMKKVLDLKTFRGFNGADLVYDRQEKAIFECNVYNDDFSNKRSVSFTQKPENYINQSVVAYESLEAPNLIEANEKGRLKGKLQEIAAGLTEESNPVIMLIKNKD